MSTGAALTNAKAESRTKKKVVIELRNCMFDRKLRDVIESCE
jgi:hypothetical protein